MASKCELWKRPDQVPNCMRLCMDVHVKMKSTLIYLAPSLPYLTRAQQTPCLQCWILSGHEISCVFVQILINFLQSIYILWMPFNTACNCILICNAAERSFYRREKHSLNIIYHAWYKWFQSTGKHFANNNSKKKICSWKIHPWSSRLCWPKNSTLGTKIPLEALNTIQDGMVFLLIHRTINLS